MRFEANGPDIPDELLVARDNGRVVLFCGSGVSRARANLPDFFDLAERVLARLGVSPEDEAHRVLEVAKWITGNIGIDGLVTADIIFGLLERDFLDRDIYDAVSRELKPDEQVDLSAHEILIELSKTAFGETRIVTTNFDRLFESCGIECDTWSQPDLPNLRQESGLDGIVYLHGRTDKHYRSAETGGYILSTAEFGRAYLSDGWATGFIKQMVEEYTVIFIGYGADDPPVRYLLEAINKDKSNDHGMYAFQSGFSRHTEDKWRFKGVTPIPYAEEDDHAALWGTLHAWSLRAQDLTRWNESIVKLAQCSPEGLEPHQRGMVAHLVSTAFGARLFADANPQPSGDWLNVFDPIERYKIQYDFRSDRATHTTIDNYQRYALDSDKEPDPPDLENLHVARAVPPNAWDAFARNQFDEKETDPTYFSHFREAYSASQPNLPKRFEPIGQWLAKNNASSTVIRWASQQVGLHESVRRLITSQLVVDTGKAPAVVHRAWQYILESMKNSLDPQTREWVDLKNHVKKSGWTGQSIRRYTELILPRVSLDGFLPRFSADGSLLLTGNSVEIDESTAVRDLVPVCIKYPEIRFKIAFPEDWLSARVAAERQVVTRGIQLELEIRPDPPYTFDPLVREEERGTDNYISRGGISGAIERFSESFRELLEYSRELARQEFQKWPPDSEGTFCRLRIWASGFLKVTDAQTFGDIVLSSSDDFFWDSHNQRDLMLSLANRWIELKTGQLDELIQRLLQGRPKRQGENSSEYREGAAFSTLSRLGWLVGQKCEINLDWETESARLKASISDWNDRYFDTVVDSQEFRGGVVITDTDIAALQDVSFRETLGHAESISGRSDDFLIEKDPFAGLVHRRPVRAFSMIRAATNADNCPNWAWRTFLGSRERDEDRKRFASLICQRMVQIISDEVLSELVFDVASWLLRVSEKKLLPGAPTRDALIGRLVCVLPRIEVLERDSSAISTREWANESLNSPAGKIAQSLFHDERSEGLPKNAGLPADWRALVESCLALEGDHKRYVLVMLGYYARWFHLVDRAWFESNLAPVFMQDINPDHDALWCGFLWEGSIPDNHLYELLKSKFLSLSVCAGAHNPTNNSRLAEILVYGWGSEKENSGEHHVSDSELRQALLNGGDGLRLQVIRAVENRSFPAGEDAEKWRAKLKTLLASVWPRNLSTKTNETSASLFNLYFRDEGGTEGIGDLIVPLVSKSDSTLIMLPMADENLQALVGKQAHETLSVLYAALPDRPTLWPYRTGDLLHLLSKKPSGVRDDKRLIELLGKWHSR